MDARDVVEHCGGEDERADDGDHLASLGARAVGGELLRGRWGAERGRRGRRRRRGGERGKEELRGELNVDEGVDDAVGAENDDAESASGVEEDELAIAETKLEEMEGVEGVERVGEIK